MAVPPSEIARHKKRLLGPRIARPANAVPWLPTDHYWHPLPAPLAAWYGYVDDPAVGCVILAAVDHLLADLPFVPDDLGSELHRIPVRAVLRHSWRVVDGYVVANLPVHGSGHPVFLAEDIEYRPRPVAWCKHFTGVNHEMCQAGVRYRDLADGFGMALRLPCVVQNELDRPEEVVGCAKVSWPTQEEIRAHEAAGDAAVKQVVERIRGGRCVECGERPDRMRQVVRSMYAEPCGHRNGVGSARAWNAKFAADTDREV